MTSEGHSLLKPSLYFMAVVAATSAAMAPASNRYPMCTSVHNDAYGRTHRRVQARLWAELAVTAPQEALAFGAVPLWKRSPKGLPVHHSVHYCFNGQSPGCVTTARVFTHR